MSIYKTCPHRVLCAVAAAAHDFVGVEEAKGTGI